MIKFKCSKCGEGLEAPESLAGQAVKCPKCELHEKVPQYKSKKVEGVSRKAGKVAGNALVRAWENTPSSFRNAFLATLGVVAALTVALYTFRIPSVFNASENQSPLYTQNSPPTHRTVKPKTFTPPPLSFPKPQALSLQKKTDVVNYDSLATLLKLRELCKSLRLLQNVRVAAAQQLKPRYDEKMLANVLNCASSGLEDLYKEARNLKIPQGLGLDGIYDGVLNAIDAEYTFQQSIIDLCRNPSSLRRQADMKAKADNVIELQNTAIVMVIGAIYERHGELLEAIVRVENIQENK